MRTRTLIRAKHSATTALRALCLLVPIIVALVVVYLIVTYDTDRNTVQNTGIPGATGPTSK